MDNIFCSVFCLTCPAPPLVPVPPHPNPLPRRGEGILCDATSRPPLASPARIASLARAPFALRKGTVVVAGMA